MTVQGLSCPSPVGSYVRRLQNLGDEARNSNRGRHQQQVESWESLQEDLVQNEEAVVEMM